MKRKETQERQKWAVRKMDGWTLTDHARVQLVEEGRDSGRDGIGNYLDEDGLQDAARDLATGHFELTIDGVPDEHYIREAAADYIYEGLLKALKEKRK